jgi:ABC-2 type transport system permease protein
VINLLAIEFTKLLRLNSLRFSLLVLLIFPALWAYAPGIYRLYGYYVVSAYQVPALSLLSSMQFLLPLLVAIASAELVGMEMTFNTLPTILLRPLTRSQWLLSKIIVAILFPFLLLLFFFVVSLLAGAPLGYGSFVGGTGVGMGGLTGEGMLAPATALVELARAYLVAALSLVPISLLAIFLTVLLMNAAAGALATLAVLILMQLLVAFSWLEPFLLTTQLSAYVSPLESWVRPMILISFYSAVFAALAVVLFERKDF